MIVVGIDPGSRFTGFGVICAEGSRLLCVDYGVLYLEKEPSLHARLAKLFTELRGILCEHRPDRVCVESIFHHQSAKSALVLGHARGVALLAAGLEGCEVDEVAPAEVKKGVTGTGRADKSQVQEMIRILLGLSSVPPTDAADALAVAVAGANRARQAGLIRSMQNAP